MLKAKLKSLLMYGLVLAAGLIVGVGAAKLPKLLERPYQQGDFSTHYAEAKTQVVVYGTTTCPYCAKTREYLGQHKVAFADFNVDKSESARKKYSELKVKSVPAILIGDRLIMGFKPDAIDAALKAARR
ncbi:glutaredoxin family protein [Massilia endophytica]|uniref:glutaredoxin family protein n=1 Tax=Massilia endophytica TaxID=2899220 RepID=UPI001E46090E|nr:glutaredoxin family protein [Massilia endophytica]UGQ47116.1 glutaredoxin family protein [Massilia endophytica]